MQVISVNNNYSSGMRRLAAAFIDHLVVVTILSILAWQFFDWSFGFDDFSFPFNWHNFFEVTFIVIYYALMESSKYQATLGKIAMGIKVVNKNNQPLDFSKALLRNLSKLLSYAILCIGYIMIIFDDRKQGLHDKIADTFVVKQ